VLRPAQPSLRSLTLALALAVVLGGVPAPAVAAPHASPAVVAEKRAQAAREAAELKTMRSQLEGKLSRQAQVTASLERTRREIADNERRLRSLQRRLGKATNGFDARVNYLYRTRDGSVLDVLFAAQTFDEFVSRLDLLTELATGDAKLVRQIREDRATAKRLRGVLDERERMLAGLRKTAAADAAKIQDDIARQQDAVGSLDADVAAMLREQDRSEAHQSATPVYNGPRTDVRKPGSGSVSLITATVAQHPGARYLVMAGQPAAYSATGVSFSGKATTYNVAENGTGTASGRPLNDNELTCAHKTLPFGTRLAVTRGSKRIIVIVTDRGPYTGGRILDLTARGASILGIDGVGKVDVEIVVPQ
jgi:rare lipoprotein A (peptidoglycan hydrolase)